LLAITGDSHQVFSAATAENTDTVAPSLCKIVQQANFGHFVQHTTKNGTK
jgi:hypothetical protein